MEVVNFKDIKVGDKVIITHNGAYAYKIIKEVTRTGNTFIEVDGQKYCNKTGALKPYKMNFYILRLANEEDINLINHTKNKLNIKYFFSDKFLKYYSKLSEEQVKEFESLMLKCEEWIDKGDIEDVE